jgi:dTDP-4-amino-4,6-dideoxygalactose transaminase
MKIKVPFSNLYDQYIELKIEIDEAIESVIKLSSFIRGPFVTKFEQEFAKCIGVKHCISCGNGTDSLFIAMKALAIKLGDEVIAPAHSWISTSETISQAGGRVVFCDTGEDDFLIDIEKIESNITEKTVGIIPVHLFGQAVNMDKILKIANKYNLWVIEDCAQAHLAKYKGKNVGTFGEVGSFSFYPGKNLGAMGDAGALVTEDFNLANLMAMYARHGGLTKSDHQIEGINSRMDGLQAAILSVKIKKLEFWNARRCEIANLYGTLLKDIPNIRLPKVNKFCEHVWHLYVICAEERDALKKYLIEQGIETSINYPIALPYLPAYKKLNHTSEDFPNAYNNQSVILSLPIFPEMSNEQVKLVSEKIINFYNN